MKKYDYLVFRTHAENKDPVYHLGRAIKPTSDGLLVDLEKNRHFDPKRVEIQKHQILLNLGADPEPGMVYGQDLNNLYRGAISTEYGIDFHKFSKFSEKVNLQVENSVSKALKALKAHGLLCVTQLPLVYELRQKTSKYAGMFKSGKDVSRITLFTHDLAHVNFDAYILVHEVAHAIDHYLVDSKELRARWVKLFMHSIKATTVPLSEAKTMWKPFSTASSVSAWKSSYEEDTEKAKVNLILRMIKQAHGIAVTDLNALMAAEEFDVIKELWPTSDLHSTELNPLITEYATKSVKETFAEALALHITGTKLPKQVIRLVDDTIQHAIGQGKNLD